ncbi:MAG TPA: proton-conducting transporter membrane subunit [Longimicrobiales bacterium]|nr:proton-conducting transporter membrane subunit [Longimicrobiales bacterium]
MVNAPVAVETASRLPALVFLVPIAAGFVVLFGARHRTFCHALALLTGAFMVVAALRIAAGVLGGSVLVAWGEELRVDALSALMVVVVSLVGFLALVYSVRYVEHGSLLEGAGLGRPERRLPLYYALVLWFLGTMAWAAVTNNVVMLYVAVEATTLSSGLLVAFLWDRRGLEAGYKYLMLLTVGVTFALLGCVVVYSAGAATGALSGADTLLISSIRDVAPLIPRRTALVAVSLLIIGFGTKAGLMPFHSWLPDAHAEAPAPVSVLLSGVMIKVAIYALVRTVSIFFPAIPQITLFAVALGGFTMLLGVLLAMVQDDLKRLLAYSSVSQMGYVLAALALGTYLGAYGGLFHLLNHAIFKALLFMTAGALVYATGARRISEMGSLARRMPLTAGCFLVGALSISGFPPFNGFMSKLTIYLALARSGLWWAVVVAVGTSVLTMVALIRPAYRMFWAAPTGDAGRFDAVREVPALLWLPMVTLAGLCLLLGVVPSLAYGLLHRAAAVLAVLGV